MLKKNKTKMPQRRKQTIVTPHSLITGPPGIIKFDNKDIAYTVIQNCTPYQIWIERNDPLVFAKHHTEEAKSERLDKKFIVSLIQQIKISSIAQEKSLR
jgi:hypothetical protein